MIKHILKALNKTKESEFHFLGHSLGIEWINDHETIMHVGTHNENRYGNAQGGALYTLADVTIIAHPILTRLPKDQIVSMLELKMNDFKPGSGKYFRAKSRILHWERKTVFGEFDIFDTSNQLIANDMGTFYIA
jgi:uncharacterized protein (TIGR00369 family)